MDEGKVLLHVLVDASMLRRIDDLRWRRRSASRAEIVRELLDAALKEADSAE